MMKKYALYLAFPLLLFLIEWSSLLTLHYFYNPFRFHMMGDEALIAVISSTAALVLGFLLADSFLSNRVLIPESTRHFPRLQINARRMGGFIFLVSVVIWMAMFINVRQLGEVLGGLDLFIKNPFKARGKIIDFVESGVEHYNIAFSFSSYVMSFNYALAIVGGMLFTHRAKWRYLGLLPLIQGTATSLISLGRFSAVTIFGYWGLSYFYAAFFQDPKETKRLLSKALMYCGIVALFLWFFFFLVVRIRTFYLKSVTSLFWKSIYSYYVGTLSAFEVFLSSEPVKTYGASGLRTIFKWLARLGLYDPQSVLSVHNPFVRIGGWTEINTYSYVKTLYEDFGIPGVLFGSAFWGGIVRWSLQRLYEKFSLVRLHVVVVMAFSLMMSFYSFYFEGLVPILLYLFYSFVTDFFMRRKKIYAF